MDRLRNKKGLLLGLLLIVLLVAGGVPAYNRFFKDKTDTPPSEGVNYRPPTEEEQDAGDKRKEEIVEEEQNQQPPPTDGTKKKATVIITDAGQYDGIIEVRSFISNHYQDGTCTITFKQGSHTLTKQTPARKDVSTTICLNPQIKRSEFPTAGTWQVTVTYESKDARGTSETQTLSIK
jgi:hypothetical protein